MHKTIVLGTAAMLSLALAACNQNTASNPTPPAPNQTAASEPAPGSNNDTVSAVKEGASSAVGKASAELTTSTKGFIEAAAMSDMYEVEASKIAMQRSASKDVKDFAKMMVDAHSATTKDLKGIVMKDKIDATPAAMLDSRHQGLIDDLKGAKAEDFDGRFVSQQTAAHEEAQILMRGYAESGENPDVKAFAAATEPKVNMHLDRIKAIGEKMSATNRRAETR